MDLARLHYASLGIVGVTLGASAVSRGWTSNDFGDIATLVGAVCLVGLSVHALATDAALTIDDRVAYITAVAALLSVAGTALTLFS